MIRRRRTAWAGGLLLTATFALAGCGQSAPSSGANVSGVASSSAAPTSMASPGGSANPAVCRDVAQLRASIAALKDVQVVKQGTDAAKQALTRVQQDFTTLVQTAHDQASAAVAKIQADAAAVRAAIAAAGSGSTPSAQELAVIRARVGVLVQDTKSLIEEVGAGC